MTATDLEIEATTVSDAEPRVPEAEQPVGSPNQPRAGDVGDSLDIVLPENGREGSVERSSKAMAETAKSSGHQMVAHGETDSESEPVNLDRAVRSPHEQDAEIDEVDEGSLGSDAQTATPWCPEVALGPKIVAIDQLHSSRMQPRHQFDEKNIRTLADSIKKCGLLQSILVRRHPESTGEFEIVAGERRYQAARLANLKEVPVVVSDLSDGEMLEFALVENVQREDLTPLEIAGGYSRLIKEFNYSQEDVAKVVCKSRSHVANTLRLLNLPPALKEVLQRRELSAGHARALLNAERPEDLARETIAQGLSVREIEDMAVPKRTNGSAKRGVKSAEKSKFATLEHSLSNVLGLEVSIRTRGQRGSMSISFNSLEQLEEIARYLLTLGARAPKATSLKVCSTDRINCS